MLKSEVETACDRFNQVFAHCEGSFIDSVATYATGAVDYVDVKLTQCQKSEFVSMLLEGVRYFSISKGDDIGGSFVDQISVTYLPRVGSPWPEEAEKLVVRFEGLPELYWLRTVGPTEMHAIAAKMVVLTSSDG
ncbi:hypothetical protein AB0K60_37050 [Thermopolyspora sp. NPDC052614]|uniref:hypothetical protein n=1 Tax=Thermopolyspora sp. NPDC052614 TaxID=3155682 RepID=UPI003435FA13